MKHLVYPLAKEKAQTDRPNLTMAVYPMGQVEGDLELFHQLGHSEVFEFQGSQSNK